ncbi:MaoC like domain-containing protein [Lentinula raphanica]|nr:MaoC like domain-containing protein [Lentinula raphanica]
MTIAPQYSWSWLIYVAFLAFSCSRSTLCGASTSLGSANIRQLDVPLLLDEFRRHNLHFQAALTQVSHDDKSDVFHLVQLGEDLEDFAQLVSQVSNNKLGKGMGLSKTQQNSAIFSDPLELQVLQTNAQSMVMDLRTVYDRRMERSHHGRPSVISREHSGPAGRPRVNIDPNFLRWAYGRRSTSSINPSFHKADQSKIPFSQRKSVLSVRFLVVAVPFHSAYLTAATDKLLSEDLKVPRTWRFAFLAYRYHSFPLQSNSNVTCALGKSDEFPEGGDSCVRLWTWRDWCSHCTKSGGKGVRVIVIGERGKGDAELYDAKAIQREENWSEKYTPRLVKCRDGTIHLDTPFSRLLGKPPIMVPGMTPSIVQAGFVCAILDAGYHVELAGGGHYNPNALRAKVAEIQTKIPQGAGITLNSIYINPAQFGFQFPLTDKAAEIIEGLKSSGIKHLGLKPGSVDGIRQVVNIAAAYRSIRKHANIILVGGPGFGAAEDVWPYLTGEWSVASDVQPMPYDGFLFGSRIMVAKEAYTNQHWEGTYTRPTGGVLTVRSELGEPIHKVATRAVKLWKEFDGTVFKLPKEKRELWLLEHHDEVIIKLNANFSKPWFGWKKDGSVAELRDMTYEETVLRMKFLSKIALLSENSQFQWDPLISRLMIPNGVPQGLTVPLANEGYKLTTPENSTSFFSPLTNEPYSKISGDFNPIHINPYLSCYAGLPATITHALWSSAATRKYVEDAVAKGHPDRVLVYDVSFVGMVLPGEELTVNIRHVGMRDDNIVVKIETVNVLGEKVLEGSAEVSQPTTAYVFTG